MSRKRYIVAALVGLAVGVFGPPVLPDDSDIFLFDDVEPNIVILIDTSGSMGGAIEGTRKLDSAKSVVIDLIENVSNVRFGVFAFNRDSDGATLVAPITAEKLAKIDAVRSLTYAGMTPLGRATQDVQDYYMGLFAEKAVSDFHDGADEDNDNDCLDDEDGSGDCSIGDAVEPYPSPIEFECQKNYAIVITDGLPNGEATTLVSDVADSMYTTDHSPLSGVQNVVVHTVGFDVPSGKDLLMSTAALGGGNFYTANNGDQLEVALLDAVQQVIEDSFAFAAPLIPSTQASGGNQAYLAAFQPDPARPVWEGEFQAYTLDGNGKIPVDADNLPLSSALAWDAGDLLDARAASTRTIYTEIGGTIRPFTVANSLVTDAMLGVVGSSRRAKLIDFIRGVDTYDTDADDNATEDRDWKLGAVFHSDPALVFPPPLASNDPDYLQFKADNAGRTSIVLVGANDGMLHAFRATDGFELWAFIPSEMLGSLKEMSAVLGEHVYSVDSSPIVTDVKIGTTWKTVAVFGMRRGGSSYHALDITDTSAPSFLWSFTDSEMGETWSEPALGNIKMADGTSRYVAFVGGGYDTDDNNQSGRALYAIDLASGDKLWQYKNTNSADSSYLNFSVAASPTAADLNGDGYIDRVYFGDVGGQVWKVDTSSAATTTASLIDNWTAKRLFTAAASQTNPPAAGEYYPAQGMYGAPALAYDDYGALWVFIGSGDRNHPKAPSTSNRMYGIKDTTTMTNGSSLVESDLVDATSGSDIVQGWYFPLAADEKVLASADVFNDLILFTTFSPIDADVCDAQTGLAQFYALKMTTGEPGLDWPTGDKLTGDEGTPSITIGGGIPSAPEVVLGTTEDAIVVGTTDGEVATTTLPSSLSKRVRYWREAFEDVTYKAKDHADDESEDDNPIENVSDDTTQDPNGGQ